MLNKSNDFNQIKCKIKHKRIIKLSKRFKIIFRNYYEISPFLMVNPTKIKNSRFKQ